jgi:hypothetical protein
MKTLIIAALALVSLSTNAELVLNPKNTLTPGWHCDVKNPDFIEARYAEKIAICKRNVSTTLKNKIYTAYTVPVSERSLYTIDHKIPLSLGGSNDSQNLWPQLKTISTATMEGLVFNLINANRIKHQEALNLVLSMKVGK